MADTIKSALFVDYDSFHRSQDDEDGDTAERLAQTSAVWVSALEGGKLILPPPENGARRRVLIRRCYADPALLGLHRSALIASGFEVRSPAPAGRRRNAADTHGDRHARRAQPRRLRRVHPVVGRYRPTPVLLRSAPTIATPWYGDERPPSARRSPTA
jgi:hypothetical protein